MSKNFAGLLLSILRLWVCSFFTPFLICLSISGNEVSWVFILWEDFSVWYSKKKSLRNLEILIHFNFLCFFVVPLLTHWEETNLCLWRILSLCSGYENRGLHILLNIFLVFFYIHSFTHKHLCVIKMDNHSIWAV